MSSSLVFIIGLIYLGAAFTFLGEGKPAWALLSFTWGVGNFVLAYLSV